MPKICCLVNPRAGGGAGSELLLKLRQLQNRLPALAQVLELQRGTAAGAVALAAQCEYIVVAGGDGTVSSVMSQFVGTQNAISILPLGTGNDLARELGCPKRRSDASLIQFFTRLPGASIRPLSLWKLRADHQELYFSNYLSFGFDAHVVREFGAERAFGNGGKWNLGVWRNRHHYFRSFLNHLHQPPIHASVLADADEQKHHPSLRGLIFPNIRCIMGLGTSSATSNPFDEFLECIPIRSVLQYGSMLTPGPQIFGRHQRPPQARTWRVNFNGTTVPFQLDGESLEDWNTSQAEVSQLGWVNVADSRAKIF